LIAMAGLVWQGCGCGSRGGPGVRGVRDVRSCSYSGAGPRPLFVARPLSKVERAHRGAGAQATNRGVVCASRECSDRLANRNGLLVSVSQRELVSLLRVVGVGVGSGLVVVQVAISQQ
jgi:hypothetical protein